MVDQKDVRVEFVSMSGLHLGVTHTHGNIFTTVGHHVEKKAQTKKGAHFKCNKSSRITKGSASRWSHPSASYQFPWEVIPLKDMPTLCLPQLYALWMARVE